VPSPTAEDLLVFYIADAAEWAAACARMDGAGFRKVESFNPYWNERGRTYADADGYRVVLQQARWIADPVPAGPAVVVRESG
jgi:hypothetical protein